MRMKVLAIEEAAENTKKADKAAWQKFKDDETNYGIAPFKNKQDPMNGWALPYVTGHRYRVHWEAGMDFEQIKIETSVRW